MLMSGPGEIYVETSYLDKDYVAFNVHHKDGFLSETSMIIAFQLKTIK